MPKPKEKAKKPRKITVSLYLDEALANTISAKAIDDRRTLSQYISIILEKHLAI